MPLPKHVLEEMGERHRLAAEEAARERARLWSTTALLCVLWSALGMYLVGWSFHTTDMLRGEVAFWAGLGVGDGGALFTLVAAMRAAERRGL